MAPRVDIARSELEALDFELAWLGRGAGALRLRLGEALEALGRSKGHHELGFASIEAYALERCERGPRWAADSRALARRLERLPSLRAALVLGELSWSMVELVARHADAESEPALLLVAMGSTVRAVRERLHGGVKSMGEDDEPTRRTLRKSVPIVDAWALAFTRLLMGAVAGSHSDDSLIEAMLAEALTLMQSLDREAANTELPPGEEEARAAWLEQLAALRSEAERAAESRVERGIERGGEHGGHAAAPAVSLLDGQRREARRLDAEVQRLAEELAKRDLRIGELFEQLRRANGWRRLGWATEAQYARERVGVSYSSLKSRRTLSRRAAALPALAEALAQARIGYEAAMLVGRVARPETAAAWVARAEGRTLKHLREEVDAVEMVASVTGDASALVPPDEATMEAYFAIETYVLSGGSALQEEPPAIANDSPEHGGTENDGQMSADGNDQRSPQNGGRSDSQMLAEGADPLNALEAALDTLPVRAGASKVTVRFRLSEELCAFWRDVEARFSRSAIPGSFLSFMCVATWKVWAHGFDMKQAYAHIYARDRFRCKSPVCPCRAVTPHHLRFRSQGGGDEDENIGSLCVWCHLQGVHEGRLTAEPPASRIRWELGRDPILVVEHRTRIRLDRLGKGGAAA